jgi:peptidoglycan hydrolase-like protein with peptidoglycan-binding domain
MKKFTFILICALSLSYASAQATCTDIKVWLTRGMENNNVLALQNFLYDRGYLKAKPNGYFGVGTFAGVKAFQKSLGLEQVGSVGPGTRAARFIIVTF